MKAPITKRRCAIFIRKSRDEGLEQQFNSLHAQRHACSAYIASQRSEGWLELAKAYDDGGVSGGTLDRPALKRLIADIDDGCINVVVVYQIDRLSRSLMAFAKLVGIFDRNSVTFVSVTQAFNTTTSMGRLTLNILLSFAQFEREVIGDRIRHKIAASRKRGMRLGGPLPMDYVVWDRKLVVQEQDAKIVRAIFEQYARIGSATELARILGAEGVKTRSGRPVDKGFLYKLLNNRTYLGEAVYKGTSYPGEHQSIIPQTLKGKCTASCAIVPANVQVAECRMSDDATTVTVVVPFKVRKRGGRKQILAPDGHPALLSHRGRMDNSLVKALARAFRWRKLLATGDYATLRELANAENIIPSYLSRILRLTLLAPEIVEAILDGRQAETATLARLMKDVPVVWAEQLYRK